MRRTPRSLRSDQGKGARAVRSMVRRMRVAVGRGVQWAVEGLVDADGEVERDEAEVFSGPILYRPKSGNRAEVLAFAIGGDGGHRVIGATRDRDLMAALEGAVAGLGSDDETILANGSLMVRLSSAGQVYIGAHGGAFKRLATVDDLEALRAVLVAWTPPGPDGGAALKTALTTLIGASEPYLWPTGTEKVQAE